MNETQSCLSENDLRELEQNRLSQQRLEQFEDHLTGCAQCREILDATDAQPLPQWQSEVCPALRDTFALGLPETRADDTTARYETFLQLLGPSDDPRMLGRIGNYEVVGIIGQGGMGVVFKAFETSLNRFVAIKVLLPHLTASGAARKRFLREAQAAAAVVDDHVLPIFGVDQWQETPYLVMKYSGGQTLQQRIGQQGPLELKEILRIGVQSAKGLAAAHAQGLVHRDVKPSNILLDGSVDRAVLMDFGLARAVDDASITRTGIITGTPQYMSPEQVRADSVDARSDLFSLGSTLYAMCAGRPPFRSESAYGVMHRITHEEPTPICEVNSDIPSWMGMIIERLMSKTVEDRFESADEVAHLMEGCLAHVQQPTSVELPDSLMPAVASRGGSSSWGKWLALAGFAFFFVLGGILLAIDLNKGKLVIECAADNVPIRIMQGETEVDKLTVSKEGATVKIAAGTYLVEVDSESDNITVEGNTVVVSRGGVETVKIQLDGADSVAESWTPPENPDPSKILQEAAADRRSGDYPTALAKHIWYHDNANRLDKGQGGVRLGSAFSYWLELGEVYPPALKKMREVRDALEVKMRDPSHVRVRFEDFQEFMSFNRTLREQERTAELFKWLDENDSEDAGRLYPVSEAALLKQKDYKLCGKYINPVSDVEKICTSYERDLKLVVRFGESYLNYMEGAFINNSATLVEILAANDRMDEAQKSVDSLEKFAEEKKLPALLQKTLHAALEKKLSMDFSKAIAEVVTAPKDETENGKSDTVDKMWVPPNNPDPHKILDEARADRASGNYQIALEKHLWYHENAIRISPSQRGVRLSFALGDWLELGEVYPPALAAMRELQDALEVKIRDENRTQIEVQDFLDFRAFNRTLRQQPRTADLFKWLDETAPETASEVYRFAEEALVKQQDYKICDKYIDSNKFAQKICDSYLKKSAKYSKGEPMFDYKNKKFVSDSATLIEILVNNDRKEEAQKVASRFRSTADTKVISAKLNRAIDTAMEKKPTVETSDGKTKKNHLKDATDSDAANWTPPENPDPSAILKEAAADRRSGDYQMALAKHIWYHENAIRIDAAQGGVRLSHALSGWFKLGEVYPPALTKMRDVRDATEAKIRDENRVRVKFEDFHDFTALNRTLREEKRTVELFKWVDKVEAEDAARVYPISKAALIQEKEYKICGKYIKPIYDVKKIYKRYNLGVEVYKEGLKTSLGFSKKHFDFVENMFINESASLVEILMYNGRETEAGKAADSLKKFAEGKGFSDRLEKSIDAALKQKQPAP